MKKFVEYQSRAEPFPEYRNFMINIPIDLIDDIIVATQFTKKEVIAELKIICANAFEEELYEK
jgi:hypothetical protein